jgi:hypothetical protein
MSVREGHVESGRPHVEQALIEKSLDLAADDVSAPQMVGRKKKPDPVKSACLHCRRRKAKCSGERPVCQPCEKRDLACQWQTPEGLTRSEGLEHELQSVKRRTDDLRMLLRGMKAGSDEEATTLLAMLRLGDPVEELAHTARTALGQSETKSPSLGYKPWSVRHTDKNERYPQYDVEGA